MLEKIEGIVIDIVRHNDSHNVVSLYTRTRGRVACIVPVGKSKAGRVRNAQLGLLSCIRADINFKGNSDLHHLRNISPLHLFPDLHFHPVKSILIFFIAEFSNRLLRQYPQDENVWDFIADSLSVLDSLKSNRGIANFHIAFLSGLLHLTGILPNAGDYRDGLQFDMSRGEYIDPALVIQYRRNDLLGERQSAFIPLLSRLDYSNMHLFRFSRPEREEILELLLRYYSYHLPIGTEFKSLPVLREILS